MALSAKRKKELAKQRKKSAKQAQKYHREQEKRAKKASEKARKKAESKSRKPSASRIEEAVNSGKTTKFRKISREEKFREEGERKIRNLRPQDFEDGYYIDEYSEKQRQERRARVIRKQEQEVIRRNKKPMTAKQVKIRRIMITAATLLLVIVIGVVLSFTVLFKTERIEVEGSSYYYDDQIIGFSNVKLQQNIFIAKMNSTPQEIIDNLAYVEDAQVDFSIPDTITITITDAVPSYYMRNGNNYLLISAKGRVLEQTATPPENLPELVCGNTTVTEPGKYLDFADPSVPEILKSVAKSLADNNFTDIRGFDVSNPSEVTFDYGGKIRVNLGVPEDIDYKLRTAQAIITKKLDPNNTGQIFGTLDVSTCSKNKMSHFIPSPTRPTTTDPTQPTTVPEGEDGYQPNDGTGNTDEWTDDSYTWTPDSNGGDAWTDDSGYADGYANNGGYGNDGGYDDAGGYGGDADSGGYDDGTGEVW